MGDQEKIVFENIQKNKKRHTTPNMTEDETIETIESFYTT